MLDTITDSELPERRLFVDDMVLIFSRFRSLIFH
jgi:hypothetical protein